MADFKVELDHDAVRSFLQSPEVAELVNSYGTRAINSLGGGYEGEPYIGPNRANYAVQATYYQTKSKGTGPILEAIGD